MPNELKEKAAADLIGLLEYQRDKNFKKAEALHEEITRLKAELIAATREFDYFKYQDEILKGLIERGLSA